MKHGKKYRESAKLIDRQKLYDTAEALDLCVKTGTTKFDETVELHVKLGVDGRHADQQVRGAVVLPNGTGKNVFWPSARATTSRPPRPPEPTMSAPRRWCRRFSPRAGWTLTW